MIDHSIYEVYQRDKKVVIPDFGAFIYSEITNTIDFNDLLNFDNGKVITEIQKQQNLPEEEARYALSEYVQQIKDTLNQGNLHFFEGIGYLAKDTQGFFSIHETMSSPDLINQEEAQEPQPIDIKENQEPLEDSTNISEYSQEKENHVEQNDMETSSIQTKTDLDEGGTIEENSAAETPEEELNTHKDNVYSYSPILSNEDEDVQDYYGRKEKYYNGGKKRSPFITAMLIAAPLILMGLAAFYYFNYYITRDVQDNDDLQQSQLSHSLSAESPAENYAEQAREAQARDDEKSTNGISSRPKNADTSRSGQQTNPADSPSAIDTPTSGNVTISQNKIYSLILGSFKEENNADKLLQRFREQGMEVGKFQRGNNFYFVGFEYIEGKSTAVKLLTEIREEEPTAWIIKKQ